MTNQNGRILFIITAIGLVLTACIGLWFSDHFQTFMNGLDATSIRDHVVGYGAWGPFVIVFMMAGAIVFTPIPSAPIALAAGAVYGHFVGMAYVATGASLGAFVAFGLSRLLGREVIEHWFGDRLDAGLFGSQNAMTFAVFASRLLPFISFDLISYAAGLTQLKFWRFAVATLTGVLPASFVLAHFGGELGSADTERIGWAVLGLGLVTGLPLIAVILKRFGRNQAEK